MQEQSQIQLAPFLASFEYQAFRGTTVLEALDLPTSEGNERLPVIATYRATQEVFSTYYPSARSNTWEIDGNPRFWEEVRQLSFHFEKEEQWKRIPEKILNFYTRYGPIKPLFVSDAMFDIVPFVRSELIWFRNLTNLVSWVRNEKLSPLREFFGREDYDFFQILSLEASVTKTQNLIQEGSILKADALKSIFRSTMAAFWSALIELVFKRMEQLQEKIREELKEARVQVSTLKDHELIGYTWDLVAKVVGAKLGTIEFVPVYQQQTKSIPPVVWYFRAYCALDAAFLQWYFQEVAPLMVRTCEAPGCNAPVLDPRAKYCSERCYWRAKKRRYLERKARNSWVRKED
jgi:hypothetical protein